MTALCKSAYEAGGGHDAVSIAYGTLSTGEDAHHIDIDDSSGTGVGDYSSVVTGSGSGSGETGGADAGTGSGDDSSGIIAGSGSDFGVFGV